MSEWLRRQTWNLLGYARAGSNPAVDAIFFPFNLCLADQFFELSQFKYYNIQKPKILGTEQGLIQSSFTSAYKQTRRISRTLSQTGMQKKYK